MVYKLKTHIDVYLKQVEDSFHWRLVMWRAVLGFGQVLDPSRTTIGYRVLPCVNGTDVTGKSVLSQGIVCVLTAGSNSTKWSFNTSGAETGIKLSDCHLFDGIDHEHFPWDILLRADSRFAPSQ